MERKRVVVVPFGVRVVCAFRRINSLGREKYDTTHREAIEYAPRIEELALARILVRPRENIV